MENNNFETLTKEILNDHLAWLDGNFDMSEDEVLSVLRAMKKFAHLCCIEQKKIDARSVKGYSNYYNEDADETVLNSKLYINEK